MGLVTWIAIAAIVLLAIGLGLGTFLSGLLMGAERIAENPVVQNATEETLQAADETVDGNANGLVLVETERTVYKQQEPVVIVVKNEGDKSVTFADSSPQVEVKNAYTQKTYDVVITQIKTELQPGETLTVTWDQKDDAGNNVGSGTYVAVVKSDESTVMGQTTFSIQA